MRNIKYTTFSAKMLALGLILLAAAGCIKDPSARTKTYTIFKPVFESKAQALAAINGNASRPVGETGKIYMKDNFIYLNEVDKGIHIINNSDPSHPVQVAFLDIPGNQDIAIRENTLYADMYGDLLAIDISNPKKVAITKRLANLFGERTYLNNIYIDSSQVVVDWIKKDTTVREDNQINTDCPNCVFMTASSSGGAAPRANGTAGSMARMVLMNDYLYAITERHSLGIVKVSNPPAPEFKSSSFAGFDLETIYPFDNKLFMGSAIGMFMYDLSNPENPSALGQFSHGRACDPVVTDGDYAYVTLHAGTHCGGDANELNVINVKDLMSPFLVKAYPLTKPTGLCKDGDLLFICDGTSGVRIYNAADPSDLKLLKQITSNEPYDVIAGNNHALIVAKDGLYQYDYSDLNKIRQLSIFSLN